MVNPITPSEFHGRSDLPDWRVVLGRIEASFRAATFDGAAKLITAIASAAEAAGHHPDLDLRYPADVYVRLTTHAAGGLTDADATLAASISALAAQVGATSQPCVAVGLEVAIDALDIDAVRPFWKAVLGYEDVPNETGQIFFLTDPRRVGPDFWFQQMDAPRPQRNRIHIDVAVPHDVAEQRVADAIAAGGHVVSDRRARAFWILADVEGNEACICTWQDRN
ncbi:MAG TPA: VOC family protein [Ilumatobacteraceae bacterium]|jgi:4a-hydroxytetrahydrobiopterin dehydratase